MDGFGQVGADVDRAGEVIEHRAHVQWEGEFAGEVADVGADGARITSNRTR